MSKWKCEICGSRFENFHAQGFDHKIYCPLCYFKKLSINLKKENQRLKSQLKQSSNVINKVNTIINQYKNFCKRNIEEEPYDNISKQNNIYWNDCISNLDNVSNILNKYNGDNK